ncbi:hypothetical protein glysoja_008766 [Glycine soja]|nr:hypothetical protein glysoja_008766 [Glycine soja]
MKNSLFLLHNANTIHFNLHSQITLPSIPLTTITTTKPFPHNRHFPRIQCCSNNNNNNSIEIDMVKNSQGIYAPKASKVVVLWDLDNKPPRGPPYDVAISLKTLAARFGDLVDFSAYANRHAFVHLPQWVLQQRRDRKNLDILERKGIITPPEPYTCGVCGRKCKTHLDLKKHFKQLHQRERQKKLNRLKSLKGKKRHRFKERFLRGNHKYDDAARTLVVPKDKPQAADWALKRQMVHSMSRGIDWLFLVSDDSDFSEMLRRAREADLGTVVVGDWDRALGRHADLWLWVPWSGVENGEVGDLVPKRRRENSRRREQGEEHGFGLEDDDDGEDEELGQEYMLLYDDDDDDEGEEEDGLYIF